MAKRLRIENQEILNATYEDAARRFTLPAGQHGGDEGYIGLLR
jgi:hypothetical protein